MLNCLNNQTDLDAIYRWSVFNRLPLKLAKCQCLHIGYGNPNYVYILGGQPIPVVEHCTVLGLIRSKNFPYSAHINSVICKASRAAGFVYRMFSTRDQAFIKKLYVAYIRPILEYINLSGTPQQSACRMISSVYNVVLLRDCLGWATCYNYVERLAHLHLDTPVNRHNHADLVTAYNALHGLLNISKDFIGLQLQAWVPTRSYGSDFVHQALNNNVKKVFKYRVSSQWNQCVCFI